MDFSKFIEKGFENFAEKTLGSFKTKQSDPWPKFMAGRALAGRNPVNLGHGSEGKVGEEQEGAHALLLVAWVGPGMACSGGTARIGGPAEN